MATEQFDIFISHNSRDKQLIEPIVQRLYDEFEIRSWLDKWDLHASAEWEPAIRRALESCRVCAVVLGANGWGPHHLREAHFALERREKEPEYRVIPVLLPGADQAAMTEMGNFFQRTHRVDFSNGVEDEEAFRRLLAAVRGEAPGPPPLTVFSINRAARQWEQAASADKPSILYRGGELRDAQGLAATHTGMLSNAAVRFLSASAQDEQQRIQAERNRTRKIITSLAAGLIVLALAAVFAYIQRSDAIAQRAEAVRQADLAEQRRKEAEQQREIAEQRRREAEEQTRIAREQKRIADEQRDIADRKTKEAVAAAEAERIARREERRQRGIATVQRNTSRSRELASTALSQIPVDPERSVLLASSALRITPTRQAEDALRESLVASHVRAAFRSDMDSAEAAAFAPDGDVILLARHLDGSHAVRTLRANTEVALKGHTGSSFEEGFSADASLLVTHDGGTAYVWDVKTGLLVKPLTNGEEVKSVSFAPAGALLLTVSDSRLVVWRMPAGDKVLELGKDEAPLGRVEFGADGRTLRGVGADGSVKIWDLGTLRLSEAACALAGGGVKSYAFSDDNGLVATAGADGRARVCDVRTGAAVAELEGRPGFFDLLKFSPDARLVASGGADGAARLWDARTGKMLRELRGHTYPVGGMAFGAAGRYLVTNSEDRSAMVWDVETGERLEELRGHDKAVVSAAFSPDGRRLLTRSEDGTARVWEVNPVRTGAPLRAHAGNVVAAAYSPDGRRLVTAGEDRKAVLWDAQTGKPLSELPGHETLVTRLAFSPDGKLVATAGGNVAFIWDAEDGRPVTKTEEQEWPVNSVAFDARGARLVTANNPDEAAYVWDARTGEKLLTLDGRAGGCAGHDEGVMDAAFNRDGSRVVTGGADNKGRIWDAATGVCLKVLEGHTNNVIGVTFDPYGGRVATASADKTARVWDVATGKQLGVLDQHNGVITKVVFNKDGTLLATASDDLKARTWDAATFRLLAVMQGHREAVLSADFSPDSRFLITASKDGKAKVWESRTGALTAELAEHTSVVWTASFSPDGRFAVTASKDGTARIYPSEKFLPLGELLQLTSERVTRPLTPTEIVTYAPFLPVVIEQPQWRLDALRRR